MSDELECFRRAAELGCPDFYTVGSLSPLHAGMMMMSPESDRPVLIGLPYRDEVSPINRYAAAVCETWWRMRAFDNENMYHLAGGMIEAARAFGKKYGGA